MEIIIRNIPEECSEFAAKMVPEFLCKIEHSVGVKGKFHNAWVEQKKLDWQKSSFHATRTS